MVAIITSDQKTSLLGEKYDGIQFFNPILDIDGNWVISEEEINQCTEEDCLWVKDLELIKYNKLPSIGVFDTVNYNKENGQALAIVVYYKNKLAIFRFNEDRKEFLLSDLNPTHFNNVLNILNVTDYRRIAYNRGRAMFRITFLDETEKVIFISDLSDGNKLILNASGTYFVNLMNS